MLFLLRRPGELLGVAIALLVGTMLHAIAQAAVARGFGDRMPAAHGRLRLDPRRHFDPFGVITMIISGVGWPKPVPLQEPRFRGARGRYVLAVLAGPATNLVLAVLGLLALRLTNAPLLLSQSPFDPQFGFTFGQRLLFEFTFVNAALGVLTLIPLPPLDGARLLWLFAPTTQGWRNARYQLEERNIGIGLCVLLLLPVFGNEGLLLRIVLTISGAFLAPIAQAFGLIIGF